MEKFIEVVFYIVDISSSLTKSPYAL